MKKKLLVASLILAGCLTACGRSNSYDYESDYGYNGIQGSAVTDSVSNSYYKDESFSTGGDYSNTLVNGEFVDYSYYFSASGELKKEDEKQDVLDYYEGLETLVNDNGGFIENLNNDYMGYAIDKATAYLSENEKAYKASGYISFTVEIPNEKIDLVTESLENFCKDNKFNVTRYTQNITNYELYDKDGEETNDWDNVITKEELEKRLKYARVDVSLSYYLPRSGISAVSIRFTSAIHEFWDSLSEAVTAFFAVAVGLIVLYLEAIAFYKGFKKAIYKHRLKKPEYYAPKPVILVDKDFSPAQAEKGNNLSEGDITPPENEE